MFVVRRLKAIVNKLALPDRWVGWAWRTSGLDRRRLGAPAVIISSGSAPQRAPRRTPAVALNSGSRSWWTSVTTGAATSTPLAARPGGSRSFGCSRGSVSRPAARVIVISAASRDVHLKRYPWLASRIVVIPNGFDPEDFPGTLPVPSTDKPNVHLLHSGSLHGFRDGRAAFRAFGEYARSRPPEVFPVLHLLGPITKDQESAARSLIPSENLSIEPGVSHAEAVRRSLSADVLVIILNADEQSDTMTGKVFEYLAARRPILVISGPCAATKLVIVHWLGCRARPAGRELGGRQLLARDRDGTECRFSRNQRGDPHRLRPPRTGTGMERQPEGDHCRMSLTGPTGRLRVAFVTSWYPSASEPTQGVFFGTRPRFSLVSSTSRWSPRGSWVFDRCCPARRADRRTARIRSKSRVRSRRGFRSPRMQASCPTTSSWRGQSIGSGKAEQPGRDPRPGGAPGRPGGCPSRSACRCAGRDHGAFPIGAPRR